MAIGPNVVDDCEGMTDEDYWRGMDEAMQDEEGDEPFCNDAEHPASAENGGRRKPAGVNRLEAFVGHRLWRLE